MSSFARIILLSIVAVTSLAGPVAYAQNPAYPSGAVRIVVPYPPGGGADVMARALAAELAPMWGKPVVVENVAGANSIVGAQKVASAAPDGLTLLMTLSGTVIGNKFLYKTLPYDPDASFVPITQVAKSGQMILASSKTRLDSVKAMLAEAKKGPDGLTFGTPGPGSQEELLIRTIAKKESITMLSIPYKGVAPALTAVIGGEVQIGVASPGLVAGLIKEGRINALAIASTQRSPLFPDIPTTAETGMPYAISTVWYGLFAPARTPGAVIEKLHADVTQIAKRPDFVSKNMTPRGLELVASNPAEFLAAIKSETAATAQMVKITELQPE